MANRAGRTARGLEDQGLRPSRTRDGRDDEDGEARPRETESRGEAAEEKVAPRWRGLSLSAPHSFRLIAAHRCSLGAEPAA